MSLCVYKNMFGKPGKGVHSYRIFNIAVVDVVMTILVALIISYVNNLPIVKVLFILFLTGIFMHRIFCVRTTVDKWLVPDNK
jgi:hypothetical protein